MTDFASESAPYTDRNPRIQALQGFGDLDRARVLAAAGEKVEALQEFQEALRFGNLAQFRYERGLFYSLLERYAEALDDFTSALLQRPQQSDVLFQRAVVGYNVALKAAGNANASFSQAFRDIILAVELDPMDERYQQLLALFRQRIPEFAPPTGP
jgi:tetratricopeptide (TPR) repeat protein